METKSSSVAENSSKKMAGNRISTSLVLEVTNDNHCNLVDYQITDNNNNIGKKSTIVHDIPLESNVSSTLLYPHVYLVGGLCDAGPSHEVLRYTMNSNPPEFTPAPSLISGKSAPILLSLGSVLYAFSSFQVHTILKYLEHSPRCEAIDTADPQGAWYALPSPPELPPPTNFHECLAYMITASAADPTSASIFLSLGWNFCEGIGLFGLRYNAPKTCWSLSSKPFPFRGQARFVDGVCFGFPCDGSLRSSAICSCKVAIDGPDDDSFCFVGLAYYDLPTFAKTPSPFYLTDLMPIHSHLISIIYAQSSGHINYPTHYFGVALIELEKCIVYERTRNLKKEVNQSWGGKQGKSRLLMCGETTQDSEIEAFIGGY